LTRSVLGLVTSGMHEISRERETRESIAMTTNKNNGHAASSGASVVTIDGPAASGKSSVSRELAARLGWQWVSTGTFYRGLAWAANELKLDLTDETALVNLAVSPRWNVEMTPNQTLFFLDGVDRTSDIANEAVGSVASKISSYPKVRLALLGAQRACAKSAATFGAGLIAEGRDCGSVVFPQAEVKVFLTARAEDRAQRRALEEGRSLEATITEQERRDHQDASRKTAPMIAPEGSKQIDTSGLSLDQVVAEIEALVRDQVQAQARS
jgi:cytidylate kinase